MNKKVAIIVIVVLVITAVILWPKKSKALIPKLVDNSGSGGSTGLGNAGSLTGGSATPVNDNNSVFPLKPGARGEEVKNIQRAINLNNSFYGGLGYAQLSVDGIWGPKTSAALEKIFSVDAGIVTKGRYQYMIDKLSAGLPIQKVDDNFPLQLTSYGPKVREVNVALGLYPSNTTNPKAFYFTQSTRDQLLGKHKRNSVDKQLYGHLMEISNGNNALLSGSVKTFKFPLQFN